MASCESAVSFISGCLKKHSTTDCLFSISFASVSGNTIHLFKRRAPIGVTVVSRTSSSDNPPSCMVFNNSRERIVNLSNLTYLSSSILERDVICDSCVCWVISRYCKIAPAAHIPLRICPTPKPLRLFTPKCLRSFCSAVCSTKAHSSSSYVNSLPPKNLKKTSFFPRSKSTSLGCKLTSNFSILSYEPSSTKNSPVDISRKATPQAALPKLIAARKLFSL